MATAHAEDRGDLPGAVRAGETPSVEGEEVVYARVAGRDVRGFLARSAQPGASAVLLIHEWWGLNDNIRDTARRLAGEGYTALAVDLYQGESSADPAQARLLAGAAMGRAAELEENLRQAQAFLRKELAAPRVGVVGWCFGGGWSLRGALALPGELEAAVIFYGRLVTDPSSLSRLQTPILGLFGALDRGIPLAQVRAFEGALAELGKQATVVVYEDADHAFANPSGNRYQPEAAADAWRRMLDFLGAHL